MRAYAVIPVRRSNWPSGKSAIAPGAPNTTMVSTGMERATLGASIRPW